jgi:autotransporter-associated beta strand protein
MISTGNINIPTSGVYTFATASDDGSMMFINVGGSWQTVVNNNMFQGVTQRVGTINLAAGLYPIEIAYYEGGGGYLLSAQGEAGAFSSLPNPNDGNNPESLFPSPLDLQFSTNPNVLGLQTSTASSQSYPNAVNVNATSTIDLGNVTTASFGQLTIGSSQLNVIASGSAGSSLTRSAIFGPTSLTGNPTFDVAGSGNALYLGSMFDNAVARTITIQDSGTVFLTAASDLSQGTIVNVSGNLTLGASNALGSAARVNLTGTGTFSLSPTTTVNQTISSLSGGATTTVNLGAGALTISGSNLSSTFSGSLTDVSGGALVQAGIEPLILTGNGSGLVSGTQIFVNTSTLESDSVNALGSFAQVSVAQGATLALGANHQQFSGLSGAGTVTMFGQSFTVGNTDNASSLFSGVLASGAGGSLTKDGAGTFTITGANTHTAGTIINAGSLAAGPFPSTNSSTPLSSGLVTLNGGTLALQGQTSTATTNQGLLMQFYNATYQNGDLGTGSSSDLTQMNNHFSSIQSSLVSSSLSTAGATYLEFPGSGANGTTPPIGTGNTNNGNAFSAQGFNQTANY